MEYIVKESTREKHITEGTNRDERDDRTYRRLTLTDRDLAPMKQDKMIDVAFHLYERNVLAKRAIDLTVNYLLADGVRYETKDDNVKEVIDKFWDDPVNHWDLKQDNRVRELHLTGEQAYKTFSNDQNGLVRIGSVDPKQIEELISDKDNVEQLEKIKFKGDPKKYEIVRIDPKTGKYIGEVFFFAINKVSYQKRGKSDLLTVADWMDMHDRTMWSIAERTPFLLAFIWDFAIEGADGPQLRKREAELKKNPPVPGSWHVHNEKEKRTAITPDLRGRDLKDIIRIIKLQATAGSGFPLHWFGEIEDANRAGTQEMNEPVLKMLKNAQKYVRYMFEFMFQFQIAKAIEAGYLKDTKKLDKTVDVMISEPSKKDAQKLADVLVKVSTALQVATASQWLSNDKAREVIGQLVGDLGVEVKKEDEEKKLDEERTKNPILDEVAKKMKDDGTGR